ncbi:MAG: hypothetical protein COA99_09285 [Moraxellaceae bacterium]|nr:MAG: hypothetical protein COA99_09285 [Moraxellaceae bacterium]
MIFLGMTSGYFEIMQILGLLDRIEVLRGGFFWGFFIKNKGVGWGLYGPRGYDMPLSLQFITIMVRLLDVAVSFLGIPS